VTSVLGLAYTGARRIENLAREGDPSKFRFTKPMVRKNDRPENDDYHQFSFSGLKTAILNAVQDSDDIERDKSHIARGFQDALIGSLVEKTFRAAKAFNRNRVVLGGGVACNSALVNAMQERVNEIGATVFAPKPRLATDNAAMIARAGLFHFENGERSDLDLNAFASQSLPGLIAA